MVDIFYFRFDMKRKVSPLNLFNERFWKTRDGLDMILWFYITYRGYKMSLSSLENIYMKSLTNGCIKIIGLLFLCINMDILFNGLVLLFGIKNF